MKQYIIRKAKALWRFAYQALAWAGLFAVMSAIGIAGATALYWLIGAPPKWEQTGISFGTYASILFGYTLTIGMYVSLWTGKSPVACMRRPDSEIKLTAADTGCVDHHLILPYSLIYASRGNEVALLDLTHDTYDSDDMEPLEMHKQMWNLDTLIVTAQNLQTGTFTVVNMSGRPDGDKTMDETEYKRRRVSKLSNAELCRLAHQRLEAFETGDHDYYQHLLYHAVRGINNGLHQHEAGTEDETS